MTSRTILELAKRDNLVLLIAEDSQRFITCLTSRKELHAPRRCVKNRALIRQPLSPQVTYHLRETLPVVEPSTAYLIKQTKRTTRIGNPKHIGCMSVRLHVKPGSRAVEGGTGRGSRKQRTDTPPVASQGGRPCAAPKRGRRRLTSACSGTPPTPRWSISRLFLVAPLQCLP
jgi:hypothetical protein